MVSIVRFAVHSIDLCDSSGDSLCLVLVLVLGSLTGGWEAQIRRDPISHTRLAGGRKALGSTLGKSDPLEDKVARAKESTW
ncbi:uncharacterized protein M421DRAFT_382217 [Didymella exigua CBS 183.55]|uniref:Uncharacterized protein n=1 Tax=Didymella exigua CBS 183.55 TaxID=1150837 RepID=A0A6A5RNK6_9PLEO|nr:uncharacterized protein M421DRAFT_382217 [Didymella exigua CBS 183.55]KAF1929991.1 hypothetical protein M421DRAFT_382217 [Didymella exigua CBS 183.55]